MSDCGLYIAVFHLEKSRNIQAGRLGCFTFEPGFYFYVGSARKNLSARLNRHSKKEKPLRWHIDYLSVKANMLGAITIHDENITECSLARDLSKIGQVPAPGFGSSDCNCPSHLFFCRDL